MPNPSPRVVQEPEAPLPRLRHEKVIATGNGVSISIALAEPIIFLDTIHDRRRSKTKLLRGTLRLKVSKPVKVKKIYLTFKGLSQVFWPQGLPAKKHQHYHNKSIMNHTWTFFNAQFPDAEKGYGTTYHRISTPSRSKYIPKEGGSISLPSLDRITKAGATASVTNVRDIKRLSLQSVQSRSFGKGESPNCTSSVAHKGYKVFQPGEYLYNFELPIDCRLPETIKTDMSFVKYELEAMVERTGTIRPNIIGSREISFIRSPAENSLEHIEPIAIARTWEDQLHYDIIISGKSFPIGGQIPIAFSFTPLSKVCLNSIKVYVTENVQYWGKTKADGRTETPKKLILFEKRADATANSKYPGGHSITTAGGGLSWDQRVASSLGEDIAVPGATNLLGNLDTDSEVGPTEMEFAVQLPNCLHMKGKESAQQLHFDATYEHIEIHHWIKVVLRLSRRDHNDPDARKHFEISIDSPIHITSCLTSQSNINVPSYTSPPIVTATEERACGCPGAPVIGQFFPPPSRGSTNTTTTSFSTDSDASHPAQRCFTSGSGGLARPVPAHLADTHMQPVSPPQQQSTIDPIARPIHLMRMPSFAPPPFEEDTQPPLFTPPPPYTSLYQDMDQRDGLEDYFDRLRMAEQECDDNTRGSSRVDVPLTPGGRVNRSMDVPREWIRVGEPTQ
ncbi:hypothetical protein AJ80_09387 [Polytolypa hystricis UAMH7299]|uniref:Arrestin C-terminal-like domain-containing protein n=1 Tax=Polytolypa hystricis (strain UAMH7299) TaxID=1447883 RepID=A0A2B7WRZ7_POLH7|nr:hypothetical protein AJ80_09387 [Polytolypa hystricis UAMH7299]